MIPIPKPGKDHSKSINYRPIALTSCFGKTVERIVNNRLLDYLEANSFVNAVQCGCQSGTVHGQCKLHEVKESVQ